MGFFYCQEVEEIKSMGEEFNISKATKAELLEQADILNLDGVTPAIKVDELRNMVRLALGLPEVAAGLEVKTSSSWPVIIVAPDSKDKHDVQVNVNGKQYLIQRGKEVAVPPAVLEALQHAVQTVYPDQETMEPVDQQTYPFSIVKQAG